MAFPAIRKNVGAFTMKYKLKWDKFWGGMNEFTTYLGSYNKKCVRIYVLNIKVIYIDYLKYHIADPYCF